MWRAYILVFVRSWHNLARLLPMIYCFKVLRSTDRDIWAWQYSVLYGFAIIYHPIILRFPTCKWQDYYYIKSWNSNMPTCLHPSKHRTQISPILRLSSVRHHFWRVCRISEDIHDETWTRIRRRDIAYVPQRFREYTSSSVSDPDGAAQHETS